MDKLKFSLIISWIIFGFTLNQASAQVVDEALLKRQVLTVIDAVIVPDYDFSDGSALIVYAYVKNISDQPVMVLTQNLTATLLEATDTDPAVVVLDIDGSDYVDGAKIIPSAYTFAPVELHPGEAAEAVGFLDNQDKLDNVYVEYDMQNEWCKRFNTWQGRIRSNLISVTR